MVSPVDGDKKTDKVYVSPTTGKSSNKPTIDSIGVDRTTWWKAHSEGEPSSPLFSTSQVRERIVFETSEMATFFPDFELCESQESTYWQGRIEGIGDIKVTYPSTYPSQKLLVEALDLGESFNEDLKMTLWTYNGVRPAGTLVITMRLFLLRKGA